MNGDSYDDYMFSSPTAYYGAGVAVVVFGSENVETIGIEAILDGSDNTQGFAVFGAQYTSLGESYSDVTI